jgi:pimeloyl-ACP methyl ester carboxylesterase
MRRRSLICLGTAVLLLGACSASSNVTVAPAPAGSAATEPGSTGATPSSDPPAGSTAAISWQDCPTSKDYDNTGWQCGTVEVPLRYDQPSAGTIKLALTRHPATDGATRIGSLFVNPGGPGGSGIESVHFLVEELPEDVKARFDLVGFDPRGVGQSTPVDCMGDQAKDAEADLDPTPDTPAEITALTDRVGVTADACAKAQGDLLPYVGTANAARDLDRLREAVGDDQITYLGYSYGTILGATYADLFPDKVRAMVLDGAVDPTTGVDTTGEQHGGTYGDQDFQQAFARFAAACAAATGCSAGPDAKALLDHVRAQVEATPLAAPTIEAEDGRKLTIGLFETGVASALYDTASWPFLSVGLRDAANGDGSALVRLADNLNRRSPDGTWENLFDAFRAISCADFPARPTAADVTASYTAIMGTGQDVPANMPNPACQGWAPTAEPLPIVTKAATEHPVLVLGTKGDPATPYANAAAMASILGNAVELTWEGDGHTAFPKTKCVNDAVGRYLTALTAPPAGTDCPAADGGGSSTAGSAYALDRDLLRRQIEDGFKQNGTPTDLASCIARPLAEDLDENQIVHFFLGLDAAGLNDKLNAVASSCGGTFGSGASGTGTGGG